jgi:small subunit ribosomal protein S20
VANIKSSEKRIKVNERNRVQNRKYKSLVKTYIKKCLLLIQEYKTNPNDDMLKLIKETGNQVYSKIDKALKKNVFHKNTAAKKKSQIGNALKGL